MAYSSGSLILDDDYNIFATGSATGTADHNVANINSVWGAGLTDRGYGQTNTVAAVNAGATITATQWTNLLNRISSAASHQGSSITAITNPTVGDTITAYTALQNNINTVFNNRRNAAASGTDITAGGSVSGTTSWYVQAQTTTTVTFASANAARYFFNAGGMIRLTPIRSGTANTKSTDWNTLATACGTIAFTGGGSRSVAGVNYTGTNKIGGSGTTNILATTTGFYSLTPGAAETVIFKQFSAASPYTANFIQVGVALNAASTVLTFRMTFRDDAGDVTTLPDGASNTLDLVQGTTGCTHVVRPPSTAHISNTWGTPTISGSIAYIVGP